MIGPKKKTRLRESNDLPKITQLQAVKSGFWLQGLAFSTGVSSTRPLSWLCDFALLPIQDPFSCPSVLQDTDLYGCYHRAPCPLHSSLDQINRKVWQEIRSTKREVRVFVPLAPSLPCFASMTIALSGGPVTWLQLLLGPEKTPFCRVPFQAQEQKQPPAVALAAAAFLIGLLTLPLLCQQSLPSLTFIIPVECPVSCWGLNNIYLRLLFLDLLGRKATGFSAGQTGPRLSQTSQRINKTEARDWKWAPQAISASICLELHLVALQPDHVIFSTGVQLESLSTPSHP